MAKRSLSFDLPTTIDNRVVEVMVRYSKPDGSCMGQEEQGYWVSISPIEIDGHFRIFVAYSGVKGFVLPAKRFSQKKLEELFASVKSQILTGHTEDRWVRNALEVAASAGLSITQWTRKEEKVG